jgi:hypothetical protein
MYRLFSERLQNKMYIEVKIKYENNNITSSSINAVWLAWNQDNMSEWSDMSSRGMLFQ